VGNEIHKAHFNPGGDHLGLLDGWGCVLPQLASSAVMAKILRHWSGDIGVVPCFANYWSRTLR